jgi:hypothetical protein
MLFMNCDAPFSPAGSPGSPRRRSRPTTGRRLSAAGRPHISQKILALIGFPLIKAKRHIHNSHFCIPGDIFSIPILRARTYYYVHIGSRRFRISP